jgi:hypothetical protein
MDSAQKQFMLAELGVTLQSEGERDAQGQLVRGREHPGNAYVDYIVPEEPFTEGIAQTEHTMYMRGMQVEAAGGAEILAQVVAPYFDRTYEHFCSHRQTPSSGQVTHPAVVQSGRCIYFSHPIFSQCQTKAPRWCRQLLFSALDRLLPEPLVRVSAPTGLLAMLNSQPDQSRWVLHLMYYVPERRCEQFDIVEDVVPLYDVETSVRTDYPVRSVRCVPDGEELSFTMQGHRVTFAVPEVRGHQMIELTFA